MPTVVHLVQSLQLAHEALDADDPLRRDCTSMHASGAVPQGCSKVAEFSSSLPYSKRKSELVTMLPWISCDSSLED